MARLDYHSEEGCPMPDTSIEEALKQSCDALLVGDVMRLMSDLTPDALAAVMASAAGITSVPALTGYEIRSHEINGDEHVFRIAFKTSEGEVSGTATWKDIGGFWKITALSIDGV
jgi:hypothetical protein